MADYAPPIRQTGGTATPPSPLTIQPKNTFIQGENFMRIAVVGAGGVGSGFGAALAKAGADVTFIARGAHLAAMKSQGLKVLSPRGDIHLVPTRATDNPADVRQGDFVLFCVKQRDGR